MFIKRCHRWYQDVTGKTWKAWMEEYAGLSGVHGDASPWMVSSWSRDCEAPSYCVSITSTKTTCRYTNGKYWWREKSTALPSMVLQATSTSFVNQISSISSPERWTRDSNLWNYGSARLPCGWVEGRKPLPREGSTSDIRDLYIGRKDCSYAERPYLFETAEMQGKPWILIVLKLYRVISIKIIEPVRVLHQSRSWFHSYDGAHCAIYFECKAPKSPDISSSSFRWSFVHPPR